MEREWGEVKGEARRPGRRRPAGRRAPERQADFFAVLAGVFLVSDEPDELSDFFVSDLESDFVSVFVSDFESDFESELDFSDDALDRERDESRLSFL